MSKKKTDKGGGSGVDLLDKDKAKNKVKPPSKYKIVYHNDNYTPMELVVISLMHFFRRESQDAYQIMMHVHEKGRGIAKGGLSREIAETKCSHVVQWFKSQGYPLLATFEKE
jgi:ATP-dependent Clp protease adaptor protein ClpS